ncbi:MAG: hypothetical protein HY074_07110, partial [Deltaproteobacteria bacterium]|nr:hypothetical protein [Deltaproteobacteria bacterium]
VAIGAAQSSPVGYFPAGAFDDWQLGGPYYSRTGDFSSFADYMNIAHAKGELIVAASSTENEIWEELFGLTAISAVKVIQSAAANIARLLPVTDYIAGDQLTSQNSASLFARFSPARTNAVSTLSSLIAESPYVYSATSAAPGLSAPLAFGLLVLPSQPTGHAAAILDSGNGDFLLGGTVLPTPLSSTTVTAGNFNDYLFNAGFTLEPLGSTWGTSGIFQEVGPDFVARPVWANISIIRDLDTEATIKLETKGLVTLFTGRPGLEYKVTYIYPFAGTGNLSAVPSGYTSFGMDCGWDLVTAVGGCNLFNAASPLHLYTIPGEQIVVPTDFIQQVVAQTNQSSGLPAPGDAPVAPFTKLVKAPRPDKPLEFLCGIGQPVDPNTGVMWHKLTDFKVKGRTPETSFSFTRTYSTAPASGPTGDLGPNWSHGSESHLESELDALNVGVQPSACPDPVKCNVTLSDADLATLVALSPQPQTFGGVPVSCIANASQYDWAGCSGSSYCATQAPCASPGLAISPNLLWVDEGGASWRFRGDGQGNFTAPAGTGLALTLSGTTYTLKKTNGTKLVFAAAGQPGVPFGLLMSLIDPHGDSITYSYDVNGKMSSLANDFIGRISFVRDAQGRLQQINRERDNLSYTYSYDENGRFASSSDFAGNTYTYGYNQDQVGTQANGLLNNITDPLGRAITFTYYDNGKNFEQHEPGGGYRAFVYGLDSSTLQRWTRTQDLDGNTMTWYFDAAGRVLQTINPDQSRVQQTWTTDGNLATKTDELGYATRYGYDASGNQTSVQLPLDAVPMTSVYDQSFNKVTQFNPLAGSPTKTTLNPTTGDVTSISRSDSLGQVALVFGLDNFGNTVQVNNGITSYSSSTDANGLFLSTFNLHNPSTLINDIRGRVTQRSFASGRVLGYTYDDFDRVTNITDNAGPSVSVVYDAVGKILSKTLTPLNGGTPQTTLFQYDARDRLTQVTDAKGQVTQIGYNIISVGCQVRDLPTTYTDTAGRVTTMAYDNRQRLIRKTDANNHVMRYEYNSRGDKIAQTDGSGNRSTFSFDGNERLVQQTMPVTVGASGGPVSATQVMNYSYDVGGRLVSIDKYALGVANAVHSTTTMVYDSLDRVIQKTLQSGATVEDDSTFTYQRQLDSTKLSSANNANENLSFTYESAPPFALSTYGVAPGPSGGALNLANLGAYSVARDATGNIAGLTGPPGQLYSASYDSAGKLTQALSAFNSQNYSVNLGYDSFGRKSTVSHSTGLNGTLSYDALNRLTAVGYSGFDGQTTQAISENLGYDLAGNIVSLTRELGSFSFGYDPTNQLITSSFAANQGANLGPLVNRQLAYDASGNRISDNINGGGAYFANTLISDALHNYQTDAMGLGTLTQRTTPATQAIDLFTYRVDGRMTSFTKATDVNGNGAFDPGVDQVNLTAQYAFDALGRRIAKTISQNATTFTQSYLYLGDTNSILLGTAGNGATTLYLDDQRGDRHLAAIGPSGAKAYVTDHRGSVLNSEIAGSATAFGAFGEVLGTVQPISPASDAVAYGWQGLKYDPEVGMWDNGRPYDQNTGHFTVTDSIGFAGGDLNLYRSRFNNPLLYNDPSGNCAPCAVGMLVVCAMAQYNFFYWATHPIQNRDLVVPTPPAPTPSGQNGFIGPLLPQPGEQGFIGPLLPPPPPPPVDQGPPQRPVEPPEPPGTEQPIAPPFQGGTNPPVMPPTIMR